MGNELFLRLHRLKVNNLSISLTDSVKVFSFFLHQKAKIMFLMPIFRTVCTAVQADYKLYMVAVTEPICLVDCLST